MRAPVCVYATVSVWNSILWVCAVRCCRRRSHIMQYFQCKLFHILCIRSLMQVTRLDYCLLKLYKMNLFANFKWQCFGIFSIFSHSHTCAPSAYSANNSAKNFHFLVTMFSIQFSRSHWILIDIVDLRVFSRHIENCTFLEFFFTLE